MFRDSTRSPKEEGSMNNNTKSLLKDLKTATEAEAFIKKYCKNKSERLFHSYLNQVVCEKHIDMSQVIKNSRISRNYVYNIINGKKGILAVTKCWRYA